MSDTSDRPDSTPLILVGVGVAAVFVAAAAAALIPPRVESPEAMADRLVAETLRRGDRRRPWHEVTAGVT